MAANDQFVLWHFHNTNSTSIPALVAHVKLQCVIEASDVMYGNPAWMAWGIGATGLTCEHIHAMGAGCAPPPSFGRQGLDQWRTRKAQSPMLTTAVTPR
jgi:hypothetical protein